MRIDYKIPQTAEQINNKAKDIISVFSLNKIQTSIYTQEINKLVDNQQQGENIETGSLSSFGGAVFSNIVFEAKKYFDNELKEVNTFSENVVLDAVLFDIGQTKNIVTTPVQGLNGTIKEFISDGDYAINIKGVISSNKNGYFPIDEAKKLFEALKASTELSVKSWYLNQIFGISYIVITDFTVFQQQGFQNLIAFEIQAISDLPVELKLI